MMSENKRNLTEKEEYYKLITDEKSNHIETNANGAGSQCVRRNNIGSLSFRERYLSLRKKSNPQGLLFFFCSCSLYRPMQLVAPSAVRMAVIYLPILRATLRVPFLGGFRAQGLSTGESGGFLRGKSPFHPGKPRLCSEVVRRIFVY